MVEVLSDQGVTEKEGVVAALLSPEWKSPAVVRARCHQFSGNQRLLDRLEGEGLELAGRIKKCREGVRWRRMRVVKVCEGMLRGLEDEADVLEEELRGLKEELEWVKAREKNDRIREVIREMLGQGATVSVLRKRGELRSA